MVDGIQGTILAQVAITALSLQDLSSTHWVARALFLFAVGSGCISVYCACVVQGMVGKLYDAERVRNWISLPPTSGDTLTDNGPQVPGVSLAAIFIVRAPFNLVEYCLVSFLSGLAVYLGFLWSKGLDSGVGKGDNRSVFITYMVGCGVCIIFYALTFSTKYIESVLRTGRLREDFKRVLGSGGSSISPLTMLRQNLQTRRSPAIQSTSVQQPHQATPYPERDASGDNLAAALELAAQAHEQCAEADRRVARCIQQEARGT